MKKSFEFFEQDLKLTEELNRCLRRLIKTEDEKEKRQILKKVREIKAKDKELSNILRKRVNITTKTSRAKSVK